MSCPDWSVVVRAGRAGGDERAGTGADVDLIALASRCVNTVCFSLQSGHSAAVSTVGRFIAGPYRRRALPGRTEVPGGRQRPRPDAAGGGALALAGDRISQRIQPVAQHPGGIEHLGHADARAPGDGGRRQVGTVLQRPAGWQRRGRRPRRQQCAGPDPRPPIRVTGRPRRGWGDGCRRPADGWPGSPRVSA